jgi:hypothetical protein
MTESISLREESKQHDGDCGRRRRMWQSESDAPPCRKLRHNDTESPKRYRDNGARIKCALRRDAQPSMRRPGGDRENQTENGLACADTGAANRARDKIRWGSGRAWIKIEREIKSSERPNGLRDEVERQK